MEDLAAALEAVLFFKGEPVSRSWLAKTLAVSEDDVERGLAELSDRLSGRGVILVRNNDDVALRTAAAYSSVLEEITKEELSRNLGKAGLETISIILYHGPVTRADIDYIRGVNSTFIIRNLLIRGLIEKIPNPKDARSFLYQPTFDLLSHLGISSRDELPEYERVQEEIKNFQESHTHDESTQQ